MSVLANKVKSSQIQIRTLPLSEPNEIIEFLSMEKFDSAEAFEFGKKILSICAPIHDAKVYDVDLFPEEGNTDPGIPPEIKE